MEHLQNVEFYLQRERQFDDSHFFCDKRFIEHETIIRSYYDFDPKDARANKLVLIIIIIIIIIIIVIIIIIIIIIIIV